MKIPSNVTIAGIPYAVDLVTPKAAALSTKFAASIDYEGQTITIGEQAPASMEISFWHECIHGMMNALGLEDHDEKLVEGLAHQMYLFRKDNPDMLAN